MTATGSRGASNASPDPFIGRIDETRRFESALHAAAAHRPTVFLVIGEAGVGKSTLVARCGAQARAAGARVVLGNCVQVANAMLPYAPFVEMLRSLVRDLGADELRDLLGAGHSAVAPLAPELAPELAAPDAPEASGARVVDDTAWGQGRLFEAMLSLLDGLGRRQPIVLVVEDLHWADRATLDLLNFLVRNLRDHRVVLIGTERAEVARGASLRAWTAEVQRVPIVERVDLRRFGRAEVVALLTAHLGRAPSAELADEIFRRSEGNAFFAEELLAAERSTPGSFPVTLRDTLLARVEALADDAQRVARAIAVGGGRVEHDLLADVCDLDAPAMLHALDDAVQQHVVVVDGDAYTFRHAAFAEAIYGSLLPGERARLHTAYAVALDAEHRRDDPGAATQRAAHWDAAGDVTRALPATIDAAKVARRQHAPDQSARLWERALELWERVRDPGSVPDVDAFELQCNAAEALNMAGHAPRAAAIVERVLATVDPVAQPHLAGRLHERVGWFRSRSGDEDGALAAYARAIELVPADPPSVERSLALAAWGRALTRRRDIEQALRYCREAVDIAVAAGLADQEGTARHALGQALAAGGDADAALPELVHAANAALQRGDLIELGWTCIHILGVAAQAGRIEAGVRAVLDQADAARRLGLERVVAGLLDCIAAAGYVDLGRWDDAEALMRAVEARGPSGLEVIALHLGRGTLAVRRGDLAGAAEHLHAAHAMTLGVQDGRMNGLVHDGLAELARLEGRLDDARQIVAEGLERIAHTGDDDMIARLCFTGMQVEAMIAEREAAPGAPGAPGAPSADVAANVARLRAIVDRRDPRQAFFVRGAASDASALSALAEADRIEGRASPETWTDAVDAWTRLGVPYGEAFARWRSAEALFAAGRRDDALAELQRAHDRAAALGAAPLLAGIDALARRAHVALTDESQPVATGGADAGLTPRELDVLRLVATGSTNRQIGAELFISEKTASVHVSRILTKLGVSTRGQAAAVARVRGLVDDIDG
jgi:DNA-binding CsgD family transcriptional regulator